MNQDIDNNILIQPRRNKNEKILPKTGILVVNPSEAVRCHQALRKEGGEGRPLFNSDLTLSSGKQYFVAGPAIGSPMAAMSMEKLIALGAKRIILFGWCGALSDTLKIGDTLLPDAMKSGEGTSCYYPLPLPAKPSAYLRKCLEDSFSDAGTLVKKGRVWSTDAVYREHRHMLQELAEKDGVIAIDMEFSALCSVASFRNIQFAAVLIVSDELWGESWKPGFNSDLFHLSKKKALDIVLSRVADFKE